MERSDAGRAGARAGPARDLATVRRRLPERDPIEILSEQNRTRRAPSSCRYGIGRMLRVPRSRTTAAPLPRSRARPGSGPGSPVRASCRAGMRTPQTRAVALRRSGVWSSTSTTSTRSASGLGVGRQADGDERRARPGRDRNVRGSRSPGRRAGCGARYRLGHRNGMFELSALERYYAQIDVERLSLSLRRGSAGSARREPQGPAPYLRAGPDKAGRRGHRRTLADPPHSATHAAARRSHGRHDRRADRPVPADDSRRHRVPGVPVQPRGRRAPGRRRRIGGNPLLPRVVRGPVTRPAVPAGEGGAALGAGDLRPAASAGHGSCRQARRAS